MIREIFRLIPNEIQEKLKLYYYNRKSNDFSFYKENEKYKTVASGGWSILTNSPLYFVVKDIKRYERFYKVSQGDVVIDAGANEGIFSLVYSKKVKQFGIVYAFEPDNTNIMRLQDNFSLNENVNNILLQKKGLWSCKGFKPFYEAGNVSSSLFYESINSSTREIEVTSIDEFVKLVKLPKVDFIKMDIEGAEVEALEGSVETIKLFRPHFAIASYHMVEDEQTYKKLEAFFEKINYPYRTIFYEDGEILTYAGPQFEEKNQ